MYALVNGDKVEHLIPVIPERDENTIGLNKMTDEQLAEKGYYKIERIDKSEGLPHIDSKMHVDHTESKVYEIITGTDYTADEKQAMVDDSLERLMSQCFNLSLIIEHHVSTNHHLTDSDKTSLKRLQTQLSFLEIKSEPSNQGSIQELNKLTHLATKELLKFVTKLPENIFNLQQEIDDLC